MWKFVLGFDVDSDSDIADADSLSKSGLILETALLLKIQPDLEISTSPEGTLGELKMESSRSISKFDRYWNAKNLKCNTGTRSTRIFRTSLATVQQCNRAAAQQWNRATEQQCNSAAAHQSSSATVQSCNSASCTRQCQGVATLFFHITNTDWETVLCGWEVIRYSLHKLRPVFF